MRLSRHVRRLIDRLIGPAASVGRRPGLVDYTLAPFDHRPPRLPVPVPATASILSQSNLNFRRNGNA